MAEFKSVAVGLDGECVADHDNQQDEDIAVLAPDSAQSFSETVVHGFCASRIVSIALVEYIITLCSFTSL